jgi:hypothetical protein
VPPPFCRATAARASAPAGQSPAPPATES